MTWCWWERPVQWFGKKRATVATVKDGRLIRIHMRSLGKRTVIVGADVLCSNCGEWIGPRDDAIIVKDGMGSTRNEHKQCEASPALETTTPA